MTLILLLLTTIAKADFPVQASVQLIPPYTLRVSDLYSSSTDKMVITLINTDLTKASLGVRLRLYIESQGIVLRSKDGVYYPTITLDAGIPARLTQGDLAPYFNVDNLDLTGLTRAQYTQQGTLPEGFYTISCEVIEVLTGRVLSRKSSAMAWISLSDPPLLNLPAKQESIAFRNPQNILFNWTPRHLSSPNSAFNTSYDFTLVEIWDNVIAPEVAFTTAQPLYQTNTTATTLLYGPAETPLIAGKRYAWRVQAKASNGIDNLDLFRNNGYSEIFWFTYQDNCQPPTNPQAEPGTGRATISWTPGVQLLDSTYTVDYRVQGQTNWYSSTTTASKQMLYDLTVNQTYEYRVGVACASGTGYTYTDIKTFVMTGSKDTAGINCGKITPALNITNQNLATTMLNGDRITAGDFPVVLTQVSGTKSFSGKGYVTIPMLSNAKVKVTFSNIGINTDKQLISGYIETTYDSTESQIANVNKIIENIEGAIEGGNNTGHVVTGESAADYTVNFTIPENCTTCTFTSDGKGGGTMNFGNNNTLTVDHLPATVKDASGTTYSIGQDGKLTKIGTATEASKNLVAGADKTAIDTSKGIVNFTAHPDQHYAFDKYIAAYDNNETWGKRYEALGSYRVSAKAIAQGVTDVVLAEIALKNDLKPDSVQFVSGTGTVYTKAKYNNKDNAWVINLVGGPANDAQEIYALYPQPDGKAANLGKLLVAAYPAREKKLVLVPVNGITGFDEKAIADSLNAIYNSINIRFTVSTDQSFSSSSISAWDEDNNGALNVSGSGLLSVYTPEMKALNSAYKGVNKTLDKDAVYMFVLDKAADSMVLGDMPRNKQFGYLFVQDNKAIPYTVAHEMAHGFFSLQHLFDYSGMHRTESLPANLMDYPAGNRLSKLQWDCIHDPALVIGAFESDGDAMSYKLYQIDSAFRNKDNKTVSFLAPTGEIITVPQKTVYNIWFNYGSAYHDEDKSYLEYYDSLLAGTLYRFSIKTSETTYETYEFNAEQSNYVGVNSGTAYVQNVDFDNVDGFAYPVPCDGKYTLYKFPVGSDGYFSKLAGKAASLNFFSIASLFTPFKGSFQPMKRDNNTISQVVDSIVRQNCSYCISSITLTMLKGRCNTQELIWVDKIAQMRTIYPLYFDRFTQLEIVNPHPFKITIVDNPNQEGSWEQPRTLYFKGKTPEMGKDYDTVYASEFPWANYLATHPEVVSNFTSNKTEFYRTFIEQFDLFIKQGNQSSDDFWNSVTKSTSVGAITAQVYKDELFQLQAVNPLKKLIALDLMINSSTNYFTTLETPCVKLFSTFNESDYIQVLTYITDSIGIKKVYDAFYNHSDYAGGRQNLTEILCLISSMVSQTGYGIESEDRYAHYMKEIDKIPGVEGNLWQFSNFKWNFLDNGLIRMYERDDKTSFDVKYNDIVPIQMIGGFEFRGVKYQDGTIIRVPAIMAVLMNHLGRMEVTEKVTWTGVNTIMLAVGIAEIKVAFEAAKLVRMGLAVADAIGTTTSIIAQQVNDTYMPAKLRGEVQLAAALLSLPNALSKIAEIEKVVDDLDAAIAGAEKSMAKGEVLAAMYAAKRQISLAMTDSKDAVEIFNRISKVGIAEEDLKPFKEILSSLSKNDNNVYLVVFRNKQNNIKLLANGRETVLEDYSLGAYLKKWYPNAAQNGKKIILLSGQDAATAQKLAKNYEGTIIANDGWVRLHDNGVIESSKPFKEYTAAGSVESAKEVTGLGSASNTAAKFSIKVGAWTELDAQAANYVQKLKNEKLTYIAGKFRQFSDEERIRFMKNFDDNTPINYKRLLDDETKSMINNWRADEYFANPAGMDKYHYSSADKLEHAVLGDYAPPEDPVLSMRPKKMTGGGHGEDGYQYQIKCGYNPEVKYTFDNKVRTGNVPGHEDPLKATGGEQSWYPPDWTKQDISDAEQYVKNHNPAAWTALPEGGVIYDNYKNVRVGIVKTQGAIGTSFPDKMMQPSMTGAHWELNPTIIKN
ncbi:fibronectin type III domain protein [Filimonas lacunae]|nr:fibronectin type III domain protein [Filimonas lacunae]